MKLMKKALAVLLALLMLLPFGTVSFAAGEEPEIVASGDCGAEGSDVQYKLYSDGLLTVEGSGTIKERAFYQNHSIKTLQIGEGIVDIELSAFASCLNLETIVLPDSLERIGNWAFYCCRALQSLEGGNHMKSLGKGALAATGLKKYRIPDSVETIDECLYLFDDSTAIEEVIFGRGIQELSDSGIQDYRYGTLTKVVFLNKDTEIPNGPFNNMFSTGEIPTFYSFAGGAVEAYANQYGHPFVDLATYHEYDDGVITVYPTETTPGEIVYTCALCGQENRVELPVALTVVERGDCGAEGSDVQYVLYSDGTMVVSGDGAVKEKAFENREDITALWVMDGVTEIGESAFSDCHYMQTLSLADTVKALDDFAFLDCFRLSAVDFGNGLESLGEDSLRGFPLSGPVILPDSLKTIALQAFEYTNFKTIVFGTGLEYAESGALYCTCVDRVALLNGNTVIGENNQGDLTWMNAGYGPTVYSYAGGSVEENAILNDRTFVDLTAIEETDHNWSDGVITTLPTCTETGVKTYVCLNNPTHTYTEVISKIPHKWVLDSNTEPTCDTTGSRVYSCALCDATHTETLPATGEHIYDDGVITVYPTETTDGEILYTCTLCGDTYTDTVPATPYQDWLYTEAEPIEHKQIGPDVYYTLYADGHASIYGSGDSYTDAEWNDEQNRSIFGLSQRNNVTSIEIHEGVTGLLMDFACSSCHSVQSLKLPASFVNMTWQTFYHCSALQTIEVDPANPSWTAVDNVLFNKDQTELVLCAISKPGETYTIPATVETIGINAFFCNKNLKEITIPGSVRTIGETAFMGCVALETVHFNDGLETMERGAFYRCYALKSVELPASVTVLGDYVFGDEKSLTSITLPNGLTSIGEYGIGCCTKVESITIPGSVTSIGSSAFWSWTSLQHVYFTCTQAEWDAIEIGEWNEPLQDANTQIHFGGHTYDEGVITTPATCGEAGVRTYTCIYCGGTRTETIPATGEHTYDDGVITVYPTETTDGEIRYTCTKCGDTYTDTVPATPYQDWLYTESYPTGNGQIGEHVYYTTYYDGHVSIYGEGETYPTSHYVPYDYYYRPIGGNPTSIEVHEGVTGLMCKGMFCNYPQLEYVKLPASLTYIESMVFDTIQVLTAVDVAAANPSYTSQNGILFNKDMTELLLYPSGKTENSYTVPDGVEIIGEMAFHKNPVLKTVTLPDSVKEIGNTAFNSSVLETVNLGNGLETIERFAFSNCKNLESIRIPTSVKFIGRGVFQFDDNFKNVYYDCPQDAWNAIEFEPLVYENENDELLNATFTFGEHAWGDWTIVQNSTDTESGLAQRVCQANPDHTESFAIPAYGPAIEIGDCGQDGDPVYYIVYEDGTLLITGTGAIRSDMFNSGNVSVSANVHNTNRLIIEDGVTAIGNSAFAFLHFNSIDFGNTLVSIGYDAFYDNDGFETVVLPDSVKTVGDCAFGLSSYLKTVVFGPNVETVGDWALLQCYNLENVVFLNKDTQIIEGEHQEHLGTVLHTVNSGTIYGYAGGAVETYARTYGFNFVAIDRIDWIELPYGDDGLQDGDWYLDDVAFIDVVGRGQTQAEKDAALESLHRHVKFFYNPDDNLFRIRYDYNKLPIDGEPASGTAVYPFVFLSDPEAASLFDYEALQECIVTYKAPTQPDEPTQPDQPEKKETWLDHLLAPLKSAVSTILSFFRKLFKKKK